MSRDVLLISRRRKRRWALVKHAARFAVLIIVLTLAIGFFYLPFLRISSISLAGVDSLDKGFLLSNVKQMIEGKYFHIFPKNNILIFPRHELDRVFSEILRVGSFSINRNFLTAGLNITLRERKTWAIWCAFTENTESCFLMDKEGFLFDKSPDITGSAVLKIKDERNIDSPLGKKVLTDEDAARLNYFIEKISSKLSESVSMIEIKEGGISNLYLKSGWYLILDSDVADVDKAIENMSITLSTLKEKSGKLEYIDLRFKDKVFYKFVGAN